MTRKKNPVTSEIITEEKPNSPPTVQIIEGPSGIVSADSVTFTFVGKDSDGTLNSYHYDLYRAGLSDRTILYLEGYTEPMSHTYRNLRETSYKFTVKAEDDDGALSAPATRNFTVQLPTEPDSALRGFVPVPIGDDTLRVSIVDKDTGKSLKNIHISSSLYSESDVVGLFFEDPDGKYLSKLQYIPLDVFSKPVENVPLEIRMQEAMGDWAITEN